MEKGLMHAQKDIYDFQLRNNVIRSIIRTRKIKIKKYVFK